VEEPPTVPTGPPRRLRGLVLAAVACVLFLVLLAGGGFAGWWFWFAQRSQPSDVADNTEASPAKDPDGTKEPAGNPAGVDRGPSVAFRPLTPEQIYRRLLKSSAWVIVPNPEKAKGWGSAALVHKQHKLLLTNYHVVKDDREVTVFFPDYRNNEPVSDPQHYVDEYLQKGKLGFKGKVVWTEAGKDLALIQLADALPEQLREVPLARKSPSTGETVISIGASGVGVNKQKHLDGMLWRYTRGDVRGAYRDKFDYKDGQTVNGSLVETSSNFNPGDSGGPIVNQRAELVAVVTASDRGQDAVAKNVDVVEVHALLRTYFEKELGLTWEPGPAETGTRLADQLTTLIRQLGNPATRLEAVNHLGEMEAEAQAAVPHLLPLLKDMDPDVSRAVAKALDRIGTPDLLDLPLLYKALTDEHLPTRLYAARMLSRYDPMTREGFALALGAVDRDPDANVREFAVVVIANYLPGWRDALPRLMERMCSDEDRAVRQKARDVTLLLITRLKPEDRYDFVDYFRKRLPDKVWQVRKMAATVLAIFIGEEYRDLLPTLVKVLKDENEEVRRETLKALLEHKHQVPKDNVPFLLQALKEEHRETRRFAYAAIGKFVPDAREALPDFIRALQDPDPEVRDSAVAGVSTFGPDAREAVPGLLAALKMPDSSDDLRRKAVEALARIGRHPLMVAALLTALEDKNADVRLRAEDALAHLELTKSDVPALGRALDNPESAQLRANAAEALGRLGPEAAPAVPPLTTAAKDRNLAVRIRAVRALGKIGPEAKSAAPVLAEILLEKLPADDPGTTTLHTRPALGLGPEAIYERTLKSAAWIVVRRTDGRRVTGSGSLIHLQQRLLLTNYHVIDSASEVRVYFPFYQEDKLVTTPATYLSQDAKLGLTARVLHPDAKRDLALLVLDRVPPGVLTLPLAYQSPLTNQNVYSIGASGISDGLLWRSATGQVNQVYYDEELRVRAVAIQSPIYPGDSGGPIVNDRGEQVAVVVAHRKDKPLVSYGIDITEVREFLKDASLVHHLNLTGAGSTASAALSGSAGELRDSAATALGQIGPEAKGAVPALREALKSTKDGAVRRSAIVALGAIGPGAKAALGALVDQLRTPEHRDLVVESLAKISTEPDSVDKLLDQLYTSNAEIRLGVVEALGKIGPPAKKAVTKLSAVWRGDRDVRVRQAAAEALHRVQDKP
jgi:HEAT repeat protein